MLTSLNVRLDSGSDQIEEQATGDYLLRKAFQSRPLNESHFWESSASTLTNQELGETKSFVSQDFVKSLWDNADQVLTSINDEELVMCESPKVLTATQFNIAHRNPSLHPQIPKQARSLTYSDSNNTTDYNVSSLNASAQLPEYGLFFPSIDKIWLPLKPDQTFSDKPCSSSQLRPGNESSKTPRLANMCRRPSTLALSDPNQKIWVTEPKDSCNINSNEIKANFTPDLCSNTIEMKSKPLTLNFTEFIPKQQVHGNLVQSLHSENAVQIKKLPHGALCSLDSNSFISPTSSLGSSSSSSTTATNISTRCDGEYVLSHHRYRKFSSPSSTLVSNRYSSIGAEAVEYTSLIQSSTMVFDDLNHAASTDSVLTIYDRNRNRNTTTNKHDDIVNAIVKRNFNLSRCNTVANNTHHSNHNPEFHQSTGESFKFVREYLNSVSNYIINSIDDETINHLRKKPVANPISNDQRDRAIFETLVQHGCFSIVRFKDQRIDIYYIPNGLDEHTNIGLSLPLTSSINDFNQEYGVVHDRKMYNMNVVQFIKPSNVKPGDCVIVEADRGKDLGMVEQVGVKWEYLQNLFSSTDENCPNITDKSDKKQNKTNYITMKSVLEKKKIYRLAKLNEIFLIIPKSFEEKKAINTCQLKVLTFNLPMAVVGAEYQWDRKKLTFYYVSNIRIDFRELVRELFQVYKTRIWLSPVTPLNPYAIQSPSFNPYSV